MLPVVLERHEGDALRAAPTLARDHEAAARTVAPVGSPHSRAAVTQPRASSRGRSSSSGGDAA